MGGLICENTDVVKVIPALSIPSSGLFPRLCLSRLERTTSLREKGRGSAMGGEESLRKRY